MEILYATLGGLFLAAVIIYFRYFRKNNFSFLLNRKPKAKNSETVKLELENDIETPLANAWVQSLTDTWFEYVYDPPGQTYPCSDGMDYYHLVKENGKYAELVMPDEGPYSVPSDLYGEALEMPACKEYLAMKDLFMQKISAAVMVVIILGECISFAFVG